jgi:hypothetical protein
MNPIRCKLIVDSVTRNQYNQEVVTLNTSYPANHAASNENRSFAKATPSAEFKVVLDQPGVQGLLVPGQYVYLDLTPAGQDRVAGTSTRHPDMEYGRVVDRRAPHHPLDDAPTLNRTLAEHPVSNRPLVERENEDLSNVDTAKEAVNAGTGSGSGAGSSARVATYT